MNRYAAYPHPVRGGFWAMIRLCRDSRPSPVMEAGEKPKVFPTRGEASDECLKHILAFMNGAEIRGERFDEHSSIKEVRKATAERIFIKGKQIAVERIGA